MVSRHMDRAQSTRAAVLDLLARFPAMSRSHVGDVLFNGNTRAANRVLLSLSRVGRLYRFPLMPHGQYIYSLTKRPATHLEHHLTIAGLYSALVRGASAWPVLGAANVELQKGLVTDLLAVAGDVAILTEVHLGTNAFGTKLDRYGDYRTSGQWEQALWWQPGMRVIVWLVAPPAGVARLERVAAAHRTTGMRLVVSPLPRALADAWGQLMGTPVRPVSDPTTARGQPALRWRLPTTHTGGGGAS